LCSQDSIVSTTSRFHKVVVELGIGDGQLLEKVVRNQNSTRTCYVGVEIDAKQIQVARDKLRENNVYLINESFEKILSCFPDNYVDEFIFVLPPPEYIDRSKESLWISFYQDIYKKLKEKGTLTIVTEITNDLLEPVTDNEFRTWKNWLICKFVNLGFMVKESFDDSPVYYNSHYLEQFGGDRSRIKIITLILIKPQSGST
jgi:tRNA G46 methylase TrmB